MPHTPTEIFDQIAFARNTIAEVQGSEALRKDLIISPDGKRVSKLGIFGPLSLQTRWLLFDRGTTSVSTVITLIAESGEVFPMEARSDGDFPLEQGAIHLK